MAIKYEDFTRLDIRVGEVKSAEAIPKSRNLLRLEVDIGEDSLRQIVAGLAGCYEPDALVGKKVVVLANLAPRTLMGIESQGMILAADVNKTPFLLEVDESKIQNVPTGSKVR